MPRRDALSEEKRKRLMHEHEQLQKLMLQARSSVRRSSMKDQPDDRSPETSEAPERAIENESVPNETPIERSKEKKPLTENELFQNPIPGKRTEEKPVTETEFFRETNRAAESNEISKKGAANVILPNPGSATWIVQPGSRQDEYVRTQTVSEGTLRPEAPLQTDEDWVAFNNAIERRRKRARVLTFTLIAVLLVGFGAYYFYTNGLFKNTIIAKPGGKARQQQTLQPPVSTPSDSTSIQKTASAQPLDVNTKNKTTAAASEKEKVGKNEKKSQSASDAQRNSGNTNAVTNPASTTSNSALGKYKVISKAYFHTEPDANTRRKAFITHWDDAVLTPLDDKNGFIYIVFTNHLGQTSKGWLRKSDLQRID